MELACFEKRWLEDGGTVEEAKFIGKALSRYPETCEFFLAAFGQSLFERFELPKRIRFIQEQLKDGDAFLEVANISYDGKTLILQDEIGDFKNLHIFVTSFQSNSFISYNIEIPGKPLWVFDEIEGRISFDDMGGFRCFTETKRIAMFIRLISNRLDYPEKIENS